MVALAATLALVIAPLALRRDLGCPVWLWLWLAASLSAPATFALVERRITRRNGYPLFNLTVLARSAVAWGLVAVAVTSPGTGSTLPLPASSGSRQT
jgi:hypothetical protein